MEHLKIGEQSDSDFALTLQTQLEQIARAHGFQDYTAMQRSLIADKNHLDDEANYRLLKSLAPVKHDTDEYLRKRSLPAVDITGLVPLQDMIQSVARMIRVLLLGYTQDELEELADRMKAERAIEVDSAVFQRRQAGDHDVVIESLEAMSRPSMKIAP